MYFIQNSSKVSASAPIRATWVRTQLDLPEGWSPKEGGNATSPLHSLGSPNKGGQNQNWLPQACILGGPEQRGQNQISKPTLRVTMMPLVSQSMGLDMDRRPNGCTALSAPP